MATTGRWACPPARLAAWAAVANWTCNIPAFRRALLLVIPDLPGYGRSEQHTSMGRPVFGDLAAIGGLL